MLSYRHAFHAGNHADVLKHFVLLELLNYLNQKDKPYCYVDTHAGAGLYALNEGYATKNAEFETGIARLMDEKNLPQPLARYVKLVQSFNDEGKLDFYPGSPLVAHRAMRHTAELRDTQRLFELHPTDYKLLQENCKTLRINANFVQMSDGFAGLKAVLPPASRRALVLIDPPYEDKRDYTTLVDALAESLRRFATGTYAVWYPCLQRHELPYLIKDLKALPAKSWLNVELNVQAPSIEGFGMHGSGLFILNPPWTLADTLAQTLPTLTELLAMDDDAHFILEHGES